MKLKYRGILVVPSSVLSTYILHQAFASIANYANGDLLDVGCGRKPYRYLLNVRRYIGIEMPFSGAGLNEVDIVADANAIPYRDNSFDTVISTEVLEHVSTPELAISEISRVLKPGGTAIITVPFFHPLHEAPYDYYRYTIYGLIHLLEAADLEIIKIVARGGGGIVLIDMWFRILSSTVNRVGHGLRLPKIIVNIIMYILIVVPQYVVIGWCALGQKMVRQRGAESWKPNSYTLGHVVVARPRPKRTPKCC